MKIIIKLPPATSKIDIADWVTRLSKLIQERYAEPIVVAIVVQE